MDLRELIKHGTVGPIHSAGREIVRRIFVSVRDRNWREIAPERWESEVDSERGVIALSARHRSERVDFDWQGELAINADARSVRFSFEGIARADMDVCRLGLIVLHPVEAMIGSRATARHERGDQRLTIPTRISPQPIVDGVPIALTEPFSEIAIERADFGALMLRFEGDLFELEDQRNWGDASFKSYCTPLRLGYPRAVRKGTKVSHSVAISFEPATANATTSLPRPSPPSSSTAPSAIFPDVGVEWSRRSSLSSARSARSRFRHVYVDATTSESREILRALLEINAAANVELGLDAPDEHLLPARQLALVGAHIGRLARVLVYGVGGSAPPEAAIEACRQAIRDADGPRVPVLAATRGYYVEFNRSLPPPEHAQGMAFPLTATVHSDEAGTIVENVRTIRDMAETARQLMRSGDLAIVPLAAYYPTTPQPTNFPPQLVLPWAVATVMQAALAGVTSITLAEQLIELVGEAGTDLLSRLAECSRQEVRPVESPLASGVHAMMLGGRNTSSARILVTNLTGSPQRFQAPLPSARTMRCTDAVSGTALPIGGDGINIPATSVVWIDLKH